jgi:hypothetical protein
MLVGQQATNCDPKNNSQLIRHFNKLYPQRIECFAFLPFLFDKRLQSDSKHSLAGLAVGYSDCKRVIFMF